MTHHARLRGKVALVTGAGAGIGRAIAQRFADEGCAVGILTLDPEEGEQVAAEVSDAGVGVTLSIGDVSDPDFLAEAYQNACRMLGAPDVIVNNVGVARKATLLKSTDEDYLHQLTVNFLTAVRLTRLAVPSMIERGDGAVVSIGSAQGVFGWPGFGAYSATKGALASWSRQMANELGEHGIRFTTVIPGAVATSLNEERARAEGPDFVERSVNNQIIRRFSTPQEVAGAVAYLASEEARFITGSELVIDGGTTVKAHWYRNPPPDG